MKLLALLAAAIAPVAFLLGAAWADSVHAFDYRSGYDAGFYAGSRPTPETRVTKNLLCTYAELACSKKK